MMVSKLLHIYFSATTAALAMWSVSARINKLPDENSRPDMNRRELTTTGSTPVVVSSQCFTGDSRVQVAGKGLVAMQDLQVGDAIRTARGDGSNEFQPIYAFGHYQPNQVGDFLYIETQIPLEPLKVTGAHLVFVQGKKHPVRADSLRVGDVLARNLQWQRHPDEATINTITSIQAFGSIGMFTPLTVDGTLLVDGLAVSSYIAIQGDKEHSQWVSFPMLGIAPFVSHLDYVHFLLAPFRLLYTVVSPQPCHVYDTMTGIPVFISWAIDAVHWAHSYGGIVETFFLSLALALVAVRRMCEAILGGAWHMATIVIAAAAWTARHKKFCQNSKFKAY